MYEQESRKVNIIAHLEELRRRIIFSLVFFLIATIVSWVYVDRLVLLLEIPARGAIDRFIFLTPTEGFTAFMRVALLSGFLVSLPFILVQVGLFVRPALTHASARVIAAWLAASLICALTGTAFSYFIAAPFALKFLIGFASTRAEPMISIGRYLSFVGSFILMGAGIFQIPILMGFFTKIGLLRSRFLSERRKYAILGIFIAAGVITPTQDVFNMMLFAIPMWALFEIGVLITWVLENKERKI